MTRTDTNKNKHEQVCIELDMASEIAGDIIAPCAHLSFSAGS